MRNFFISTLISLLTTGKTGWTTTDEKIARTAKTVKTAKIADPVTDEQWLWEREKLHEYDHQGPAPYNDC